MLPSMSPLSSSPTVAPSFLGIVVSIGITTPTTEPLDETEVEYLENLVAEAYGVNNGDLNTAIEYVTTGTLDVTIPDDIPENQAIADLTTALSEVLDVSEDSITVEINPTTGEVTYTVATEDYDTTSNIQNQLQDDTLVDILNQNTDAVSIDSITSSEKIIAEVAVVVDGDEVVFPFQQAENRFDALLDDTYESETEGINFNPIKLIS